MTINNGYFDYPKTKPTADDYYLVSVKQALILKLGLAPSPLILIAKYNLLTQEWAAVLGMTSQGLGNINSQVIGWRDLPSP
jgi:hypothetical protein